MNILIVSPWLPHRTIHHAGGQHLYHTIRALTERGYRVHFLGYGRDESPAQIETLAASCDSVTILTPAYSWQQKLTHLVKTGWRRPWLIGRRTHTLLRTHLERLCAEYPIDIVHFAWTEMGRYLDAVPAGVGTVLGTLDVEHVVRQRELTLYPPGLARFLAQRRYKRLCKLEQYAVQRASVVLACSAADRAAIQQLNPAALVVIAAPWLGVSPPESLEAEQIVPGRLMFMGAMDRLANQAAAHWLLDHVWPQVRETAPQATLRLVGAHPPTALNARAVADQRVTVTGYVPDLVAEWRAADVAVCPSLIGGGLLIKVIQPLMLGRPVVTTPFGNEGAAAPPTAIDVTDDGAVFAAAVQRLLQDRDHWHQRATAGQRYAQDTFDWQISMDRLESAYKSARTLAQSP